MTDSKIVKTETAKTEKCRITVSDHPEFKGDMKTNIISTIDMAKVISELFAPVFHDYYGCNIRINDGSALPTVAASMPIGTLYVDLYFKDQGDESKGEIKNLRPYGYDEKKAAEKKEDSKPSLAERYNKVAGAGIGHAFVVTKDTKEALEVFMRSGDRTRWNEHIQEISTPMSAYGKEEVVVCVSGLDLNKLITEIYGDKTDDGRFEYVATPSTMIPGKSNEFIMQVCQLDTGVVREIQRSLGIYAASAPQFHRYTR